MTNLDSASAETQYNVLFILTDDQGVWAAGCYGNDEIRTPNIDRLARTGDAVSELLRGYAGMFSEPSDVADGPNTIPARST